MTEDSSTKSNDHGQGSIKMGWVLIVLGIMAIIMGFAFDVSVESYSSGLYGIPDKVANTDKIAVRHMILVSGWAAFLSGCVLFSSGNIVAALYDTK